VTLSLPMKTSLKLNKRLNWGSQVEDRDLVKTEIPKEALQ
jgi:hypothetical protein